MKTAEEWVKGFDRFIDLKTEIRQIQLDAMKEGARRAGIICSTTRDVHKHPKWNEGSHAIETAILSTAEQWTLNDL